LSYVRPQTQELIRRLLEPRRFIQVSAVGAHLANAAAGGECQAYYWRERNREVDFVVRAGVEKLEFAQEDPGFRDLMQQGATE